MVYHMTTKYLLLICQEKILYDRINRRVDIMIEKGLIDEVSSLYEKYGESLLTSMQAIGYKEVVEFLKGNFYKRRNDRKNKNGNKKICKKTTNLV